MPPKMLKGLLALFLVVLLAIALWQYRQEPGLAIVDLQRLINQPAVLLSRSGLAKEQQQMMLKRYAALLPNVLSNYGLSHRVTLISATVLATGSMDVTDELIDNTLEQLKPHE